MGRLRLPPSQPLPPKSSVKISVLGAGAWGTALAKVLHERHHAVTLWGHAARLADLARSHRNESLLPGVELPSDWRLETDLGRALEGSDLALLAVPSEAFRAVAQQTGSFAGIALSVCKGIEHSTLLTMSQVLRQTTPRATPVALSGPSLALEVAQGIPTALVAASEDETAARVVQDLFHRPTLRVYTTTDLRGVELGGALKNVMAIAAGVCDGLHLGDNAKAALITRGLAEMRRLGVACGARVETFNGLSGLGDLMVTCFSEKSRNRTLGERLAKGEPLADALARATAEGHPTARSAHHLAQRMGIAAPIIDEVHAILYAGKNPAQAVRDLMTRESRPED